MPFGLLVCFPVSLTYPSEKYILLLSPDSEAEELIPEEAMVCFWLAFVLILLLLTIPEIKFKV